MTAGEPAGIGPEVCLQALAQSGTSGIAVVGDPALLRHHAKGLGSALEIAEVSLTAAFDVSRPNVIPVVPIHYPVAVTAGHPNPANAAAQLQGLEIAGKAALDGHCDAIVTAPLQKSTINDAGVPFSGHTEYFAELCETELPVMLLAAGDLRVALATTHLPLREVPSAITLERVTAVLRVLHEGLQLRYGIAAPRIGVCGLNPHAGEGGHLGNEDNDVIAPAIAALTAEGLQIDGPLPADTAFAGDKVGTYDAVLAMYHDQGLPVIKYAGFGNAVNVTLGLPIIRTSVDHGTALDLAGTGRANPGSLIAALNEARRMCVNL